MNAPIVVVANAWQRLAATPVAYLLLWTGLVAVAVGCIALYRTRWGQSQPLRKCAVLSLLVHVLLAGLAMTVKIVVGDGSGGGGGGPIRIRVIDGDGIGPGAVAKVTPIVEPDSVESAEPTINETVLLPEPESEKPQTPPTAPTLIEPAAPTTEVQKPRADPPPVTDVADNKQTVLVEPTLNSGHTPVAPESIKTPDGAPAAPAAISQSVVQPNPGNSIASQRTATSQPSAAAPSGGDAPAGPGDPYAGRTAGDRIGLIEGQGGSRQTEAAVVGGLGWLSAAQSPDGRWDPTRYGAGVERKVLGEDRHGAGRDADTGITALALLAFLGAGHTHVMGDYQPTVEHGLAYLLRSQAADGSLYGGAGLYSQMYCHSMATFALAEAYAMTGDERLANGVSKAIGYSLRGQDPLSGGWRYRPLDQGDTSQLGWQVMALASGERAGMKMPLTTWNGVDRFLRNVRRGPAGGLASYRIDGRASTSMTAEALYCRQVYSEQAGGSVDERAAAEATRQILSEPPTAQRINLYYWYYATLALHHQKAVNEEAAAAWRTWNEALKTVLVEGQEASGPHAGSWAPDMMWGGYGGRVYSTALSAMCLEVYYRYKALPQPGLPGIVTRPGFQNPSR